MLGIGRVVGETMAVMMITGNAAVIPKSFFEPVRTMTATIAAEMGETVQGSEHYFALFAIGIVLFAITFVINLLADFALHGIRHRLPAFCKQPFIFMPGNRRMANIKFFYIDAALFPIAGKGFLRIKHNTAPDSAFRKIPAYQGAGGAKGFTNSSVCSNQLCRIVHDHYRTCITPEGI